PKFTRVINAAAPSNPEPARSQKRYRSEFCPQTYTSNVAREIAKPGHAARLMAAPMLVAIRSTDAAAIGPETRNERKKPIASARTPARVIAPRIRAATTERPSKLNSA